LWFINYNLFSIQSNLFNNYFIRIKNKKLILTKYKIKIKINLKKLREKYNIKKDVFYYIIMNGNNIYLNGKLIDNEFIKRKTTKGF